MIIFVLALAVSEIARGIMGTVDRVQTGEGAVARRYRRDELRAVQHVTWNPDPLNGACVGKGPMLDRVHPVVVEEHDAKFISIAQRPNEARISAREGQLATAAGDLLAYSNWAGGRRDSAIAQARNTGAHPLSDPRISSRAVGPTAGRADESVGSHHFSARCAPRRSTPRIER